jgi:hypothetical protein
MSSKIQAVTNKSPVVTSILNGLIGPFLRSTTSGEQIGGLLFKDELEMSDSTQHNSPKGYFPAKYKGATKPGDLDPTAKMVLDRRILIELDQSMSDKGPASVLAEHDAQMHITGMFVDWWYDLCSAFSEAKEAQDMIKSGSTKTLGHGKTRSMADRIPAFLAMVGELTDSEFGITENEDIDVTIVMERVVQILTPVMDALDHKAFAISLRDIQGTRGRGTLPMDGTPVTYVAPDVFEMMTHPWHRAFKYKHARKLYRQAFESRIPVEVCGLDSDFILSEGNDSFVIPASLMLSSTSPASLFDNICSHVDALAPLVTGDYSRTSAEFTDGMRTTGDLVRAIFIDRTVDVTAPSFLNVLTASIEVESFDGDNILTVGTQPWGTGGLGTTNYIIGDRTNVITGMIPYYEGYTDTYVTGGAVGHGQTFRLPNQLLDMSLVTEMTALDWRDTLHWYRRTFSTNLKMLLRETDRTRRDLKKV